MSGGAKWADLRARAVSGVLMALVGVIAVALGGWWFGTLALVAGGVMIWELAVMAGAGRAALALGIVAGAAVGAAQVVPWPLGALCLLAAPVLGMAWAGRFRWIFAVYALAILLAAHGLAWFRGQYGATWLFWLILVVIVTDIGGYFAGRSLGGPKFWPRVSPKKTWSGTVAGWVAAACVGLLFMTFTNAGRDLPWISAAVALASQMGDIVESAIKRRVGVKDSSDLIPGHGGLLDRFDGLLGAALMMLAVAQVVTVPVGGF